MNEQEHTGIEPEYKKLILGLLKLILPEAKVYLFGSRATGTHRESSDIDIAIDAGKESDFYAISEVQGMLEVSRMPYSVDIIDWQAVDPAVRKIMEKGSIKWRS